jgi:hypothetical protein
MTAFHLVPLLFAATLTMTGAHAQAKRAASAPAPAAASKPAPAPAAAAQDLKSDPEKENAGRLTAQGWLLLLDRHDWGTAWDASSALFRKNVPLGNWMDAIPKVREPFGALVERQPMQTVYKTSLPGHPNGDYVTVIFSTKFEKKADAQEMVTTMLEPDGRWRVTGYSAR